MSDGFPQTIKVEREFRVAEEVAFCGGRVSMQLFEFNNILTDLQMEISPDDVSSPGPFKQQ